jgi:hypothetical protein
MPPSGCGAEKLLDLLARFAVYRSVPPLRAELKTMVSSSADTHCRLSSEGPLRFGSSLGAVKLPCTDWRDAIHKSRSPGPPGRFE